IKPEHTTGNARGTWLTAGGLTHAVVRYRYARPSSPPGGSYARVGRVHPGPADPSAPCPRVGRLRRHRARPGRRRRRRPLRGEPLTTRNADTTPPDNSRPGLPPNAFTPRTDAQAVSPDAPFRTPIDPDRTIPGLQITGAMIDDANARWVLRLPTNWNGRLVVGVPGGFRSEFMGDFIFSDLVIQLGYAYVSTNKGMLNFFFSAPAADPAACRLSPRVAATGTLFTHFYVDDPADTIREWFLRTLQATDVPERSLEA